MRLPWRRPKQIASPATESPRLEAALSSRVGETPTIGDFLQLADVGGWATSKFSYFGNGTAVTCELALKRNGVYSTSEGAGQSDGDAFMAALLKMHGERPLDLMAPAK